MATSVLTTAIATILPGTILAAVAIARDALHCEPAARADVSIFLYLTASLVPGTVLGASFLILIARIHRLRNAAVVTLIALATSCLLLFTTRVHETVADFLTDSLRAKHISTQVESGPESAEVSALPHIVFAQLETWELVNLSSIVIVHALLFLTLCTIYRAVWTGRTPDSISTTATSLAERRQLVKILACLTCIMGVGFLFERMNQVANIPRGAWEALRKPEKMTLLSIDADGFSTNRKILGETPVSSPSDRQIVYSTLRHAAASRVHWGGWPMCFNPRHEVRVTSGTRTYEFVVCFECDQIGVLRDVRPVGAVLIDGSRNALDDILRAANIPVDFPEGEHP
jgi:hypothetical protein